MKNTLLAGVCAAALTLVAPAASQAQDMSNGWYISMFGGLSVPGALKGKFLLTTGSQYTAKTKMKDGFILGLAVGKSITENIRGEVEFAFANHKPKNRVVKGAYAYTYTPAGGSLKSYTILGNLWYDFKNTSQFTPYLGGGIGIGIVDSNMRFVNGGGAHVLKDSDVAFAFQGGAGVNIDLSPSVSLGLGYRFKGIVDFDLKETANPNIGPDKGLDLYTHNFLANVTFKFNGP